MTVDEIFQVRAELENERKHRISIAEQLEKTRDAYFNILREHAWTKLRLADIGYHAYAMSEGHLSGYRLIVGFDTLEQVQKAHEFVVQAGKQAIAEGQKP